MLKLIALGFALLALFLGPGEIALAAPGAGGPNSPLAQAPTPEFSAAQIQKFADAYKAIQAIQQEAEADMVAAVEEEDLTVERFNAIAAAQQSPDEAAGAAVSDAESDQFGNAVEQIVEIREDAQTDMESAIAAAGLDLETFSQILTQAQANPDLRQQISDQLMVE